MPVPKAARAPPGALRTTVRRQAGIRTYESPCVTWLHHHLPKPEGSVVAVCIKRPTVFSDSITVAGAVWESRLARANPLPV